MAVDDDEEYEKLCHRCKKEGQIQKCIACGKKHEHVEEGFNDGFDEEKFNKLRG